jgi:competence protein ComEC
MFRWLPYPFLRFTPVFIAGILCAYYFDPSFSPWYTAGGVLLYLASAFLLPARRRFTYSVLTGLLGLVLLFLTAFFYTDFRLAVNSNDHISRAAPDYTHYLARVKTDAEARTNSYRSILEVEALLQKDSSGHLMQTAASGKVIVYQPKADSLRLLGYGERILVRGQARELRPPMNPQEFDYRAYLAKQHIHHQHYLPDSVWTYVGSSKVNPLLAFSYRVRKKCRLILREAVPDSQARGIALALVLGIKNELDDEVRSAYAAAGAMHVLAVSGLHVGIIYLVISFMLRPLSRTGKWGYVFTALICLLTLWSYALLTGLSASVMRATVMFSFIIVAKASRRQTNIYNTIFASAFFLLLFDPLLVLSVGFQLSYLAVLGIVYLQPKIYQWYTPDNKYLDWLWGLTAVSLAAQLATFPISLFYFQQFPLYFWLSNILVIPAAYVILSLGLLCLLTGSLLPAFLFQAGWLLEKSIQFTNYGVGFIEQLPVSVLRPVYVSPHETLLLYLSIIAMLLLFAERKFGYAILMSSCLLVFAASRAYRTFDHNRQSGITFFHVPKASHVGFNLGRTNFHLGQQDDKASYHIQPYQVFKTYRTTWVDDSLKETLPRQRWKNVELLSWQGLKVAMISEPFKEKYELADKARVDLLVICNNSVKRVEEAAALFSFDKLIIDSSNSYYRAAYLRRQAEEQSIPYHCTGLQGAYTHDIHYRKLNLTR